MTPKPHMRERPSHESNRTHEQEVVRLMPLCIGEPVEDSRRRAARVQNQDVEAAKVRRGRIDELIRVCFLGDICNDRENIAPCLPFDL